MHCVDTPGPGGAEQVVLDLLTGLHSREHNVFASIRAGSWLDGALSGSAIPRCYVGPRVIPRLLRRSTQIRARTPGILHGHLLSASIDAAALGRVYGLPAIVTFHGVPDFSATGLRRALYRRMLSNASVTVVAVSEPLADYAAEWIGIARDRIVVIHNGLDFSVSTTVRTGRLREQLSLGASSRLIGTIGNMRAAKRHDLLVKAVAQLRSGGLDVHGVVIGEHAPELLSDLHQLAGVLGVHERMHFVGFRDDASALLPDFDAFVTTSDSEGFSLVVLQAMAACVPVIATRSGGPDRILDNGKWGTLVPVGDAGAVADAVQRVLERVPDVASLSAVRAHALENYGIGHTLSAYESLYSVVGRGRDRHRA